MDILYFWTVVRFDFCIKYTLAHTINYRYSATYFFHLTCIFEI